MQANMAMDGDMDYGVFTAAQIDDAFRRAFERHFSVSPGDYRRRFFSESSANERIGHVEVTPG
jgi:hypothetical protein